LAEHGTPIALFLLDPVLSPIPAIPQGNRAKKSCGDETCEEVVIPGGDFALGSEALLAGGFVDQIADHVW
jgi:hypothetical protein